MNNTLAKEFFETAYRTGSDIWSKAPFHKHISPLLASFPEDGIVLDLGTGRGKFAFRMVGEHGFRVIGVDIAKNIVEKSNNEAKLRGLQGSIRFIEGDATNIEFADASFDAITDFQLLQHLPERLWDAYAREVSRVLKPDGYYLNVSLSKKTTKFGSHHPKTAKSGSFNIDGIPYHFFTKSELNALFQGSFSVAEQVEHTFTDFNGVTFLFTLYQKTGGTRKHPQAVIE